jgi:hypothetical protein
MRNECMGRVFCMRIKDINLFSNQMIFFLVKFPILKWTFELLVDLSEKFALPGTKAD